MTSLADTVGMTLPPTDLFIVGRWVASADGGEMDVVDPATEETVTVADARVLVRRWPGCASGRDPTAPTRLGR
jgi:hypothetical protein